MKKNIILIVLLTLIINISISYSQEFETVVTRKSSLDEEEKERRIGILFLSLHPLNLWIEEPNPKFNIWAAGAQIEGKFVEILIGYASCPDYPYYTYEMFIGTNYLLVREKSTRISMGLLTEFNFNEGFELPTEPSAAVYQISITLGMGVNIIKNLWFYADTFIYRLEFTPNGILRAPFYEIEFPLLPRLVYKF